MIYESGFVQDPSFGSEVLKVGNELLKSIIEGVILFSEGLLNEFGKVGASGGFNVKGIKR